jgi:hypothetical protein
VARLFYRIIRGDVPTRQDFLSHRDLGKPLLDPALEREWAEGISVYASLERAASRARTARWKLGRCAVALSLDDGAPVEVVQTTRDRWHYTMFGSADDLMKLVIGSPIRLDGDVR